jgi:hypothetical protein
MDEVNEQGLKVDGLIIEQCDHLTQSMRQLFAICVQQIDEAPLGAV